MFFFKRDTAGNLKQDWVVITVQGLVHILFASRATKPNHKESC